MIEEKWASLLLNIEACRTICIPSHHFLVLCQLHVDIPKEPRRQYQQPIDRSSLRNPNVASRFAKDVLNHFQLSDTGEHDLNHISETLQSAFQHATTSLPVLPMKPKRPYISNATLHLIEQREVTRREGHFERELEMNRVVKKAVADDKSKYLRTLAGSRCWKDIKLLRKPLQPQQGRLQNVAGYLTDSNERAKTLTEYLEKIQ